MDGTALAPAPIDQSRPDLTTVPIGTVTYVSTPNNLLNTGPKSLDLFPVVPAGAEAADASAARAAPHTADRAVVPAGGAYGLTGISSE
ncbi:hypothetical protein [Salinispora arenicola]|uniref:hypothetical protein n=1 Tax=Salinispora arenicola TaxID=168697 RepID=UPI0004779BEB